MLQLWDEQGQSQPGGQAQRLDSGGGNGVCTSGTAAEMEKVALWWTASI